MDTQRVPKRALKVHYDELERCAKDYFADFGDREINAFYYQHFCYPEILFRMMDNEDYSDIIWKIVTEYSD